MSDKRELIATKAKKSYSNDIMCKKYLEEYDRKGIKKRVLLIDVNCKNSSTGQIVYSLFQGINKSDRVAAICYGRGKVIHETNIYKFGLDWETAIHALLARITGYNGYFSFFSTKRLIKFIGDFKPDVVHIHELHAYFVNIGMLLKYLKTENIPIVWTFHCEYMYTGKCGLAYKCVKYQTECKHCPEVKSYPKSLFFDRSNQMYRKKRELFDGLNFSLVTPSKWLEDRVRKSFLKNSTLSTIWNGVDTNYFYPRNVSGLREKMGIGAEQKIALYITSKDPTKRTVWIAQLAQAFSEKNVVFLIIGGGLFNEKIEKNMIFRGKIESKDTLAEYYSLADAFVLCSEKETYSMTCAEAMCCGTPIVGFECGAPETVFIDDENRFVPYGDITMLASALEEVLFNNK